MKKGLSLQNHTYSDGVCNQKIFIAGPPLPPPYGGISVHLQSIKATFEHQGNQVYHCNTLVPYRFRWYVLYLALLACRLLWIRPDHVYYHTLSLPNSLWELKLFVRLKRLLKYKLITVDHDCLHMLKRCQQFKNSFNRLVACIDQQVLIGDSTYQSYCDAGIDAARDVRIERAFVPPQLHAQIRPAQEFPLPDGFDLFRATHTPVILLACTRLALLDGRDLYGVDMGLEVIKQIKKEIPNTGLVCLVGCIDESDYYKTVCARIVAYGLEDTVLMINGVYRLWPILQQADLFLRPTLCDGASVGEDEAHYLGVPVVASDVCLRHSKTVTYKSGSVDDCSRQVSKVLKYDIKTQSQL